MNETLRTEIVTRDGQRASAGWTVEREERDSSGHVVAALYTMTTDW